MPFFPKKNFLSRHSRSADHGAQEPWLHLHSKYSAALIFYVEAVLLMILSLSLLAGILERNQELRQTEGSLSDESQNYIKWVDFTVTSEALTKAFRLDVDTCQSDIHLDWIQLLAFLGATYGGDFSRYQNSDLENLANNLLQGKTMEELTEGMDYYDYYLEAYSAVLGGMVGTFQAEIPASQAPPETWLSQTPSASSAQNSPEESPDSEEDTVWVYKYGLKAFSPIAKGFPYTDYDDFGAARNYGYKRQHLGHDMMGQVGTPIIAVESGTVEALGWNQYGGWRIGIRSFDQKRYYYYAHLRKNYPYQSNLQVGSQVQAGDVIGYLGRTGYSAKENTNNIQEPHLHFGIQLIFHESQKDGVNQIWISCYELVKFLQQNQSLTRKVEGTKEWQRVYQTKDLEP